MLKPGLADWITEVLPTIPEEAWVKDTASNFVGVTDRFAEIVGHAPRRLLGCNEVPFFPTKRVLQFRAADRRVIAMNAAMVVPESGPNGPLHYTLKAPIHDSRGRLAGTVGIAVQVGDGCLERLAELRQLMRCAPEREPAPDWLEYVKSTLRRQYNRPPRLVDMAREVARNPDYVTRLFRRHYGVAPMEYVQRLRSEWIANACLSKTSTLTELTYEAGFSDQSHMTRVFAHYFGLPPAKYRRAMHVPPD
jgi:AraC-like DNA-binding protein